MEIQRQNQPIALQTSTQCLIECLRKNDLIKLAEYTTSLTIAESKQGTPLGVLKKDNPRSAYTLISSAIAWLQNSLNIKNPMNDVQILDASVTIVNKYYFLRLEEIIMILGWIKTGKTGKLYQSFDVQVFCSIIEDYLKSDELSSYYEKQAQEYKDKEVKNAEMSENLRLVYEKLYFNFVYDTKKSYLEQANKHTINRTTIRHDDYYNQLKVLLPEMSEEERKELYSSFVRVNYKDGIDLINKFNESK